MRLPALIFLLLFTIIGKGQSDMGISMSSPLDPMFTFDQTQFDDRFAVHVFSDEVYDYYVIDYTKMPQRFERIYFLNLIYKDDQVVHIDPDINKTQSWFKSHERYPQTEIICKLEDFLDETLEASRLWPEADKQAWLLKYDKFNSYKIDEN